MRRGLTDALRDYKRVLARDGGGDYIIANYFGECVLKLAVRGAPSSIARLRCLISFASWRAAARELCTGEWFYYASAYTCAGGSYTCCLTVWRAAGVSCIAPLRALVRYVCAFCTVLRPCIGFVFWTVFGTFYPVAFARAVF